MSSTPLSTTATVTPWPRVWLHALLKSSACCAHGSAVIREVPRSGGQPGDCPGSEAAAGTGAWTAAMRATPSTARACLVDLGRRERPSGGMDRKAEDEPIAELLATTTTRRDALRRRCSQTRGSRLKICETRPNTVSVRRSATATTAHILCATRRAGACLPAALLPPAPGSFPR